MYEVLINGKRHGISMNDIHGSIGLQIKKYLYDNFELTSDSYYLISNGKIVRDLAVLTNGVIELVPTVPGGKGGFGSMLRAIGAQIEKTTNREACRDLSGRRLRDINEEQRLKNWINKQAEREKEAKERKQKKLERLLEKPKYEFKDDEYFKEREVLPELVEDAVIQGLEASTSSKRKPENVKEVVKYKKKKLWVDDEMDNLSSDIDSESDSEDRSVPKITESNSTSNLGDDNKVDSDSGSDKITEHQGITPESQQTSEREDVPESCGNASESVNEESSSLTGYLTVKKTNKT